MPAPLSIVIPTLNSAARLGPVIEALGVGLTEGLIAELIFADGGSTDDLAELAEGLGAGIVTSDPGRGTQLRAAILTARGDWIWVLHDDSQPASDWPAVLRKHLKDHPDRAGYGRLAFDADGLPAGLVAGWANLRSAFFGLPYGDQSLLVPRRLYNRVGGYPDIPLMEDVALARALKGRMRALPLKVTTSSAKYHAQGWLSRGGRNLILLMRYLAGADPVKLARAYRK